MREWGVMLVHYPILDRSGATVASSITNLDLHDIARSAYTYGASAYHVVHPVQAQLDLAGKIRGHWVGGSGAKRIPDREPPLSLIRLHRSIEDAVAEYPNGVELWSTSAQKLESSISHAAARAKTLESGPPILIVLGTGWGLSASVHERAEHCLDPLLSPREDGFNHLSVRAAASIFFERLFGSPV